MTREKALRFFLLILVLAGLLRVIGLFTYDYKRLPSEGDVRLNTAYMWQRNTLELREYAYPSLYFYIEFAVQKVSYYTLKILGVTRSSLDFLFSGKFWDVLYTTGRSLSVLFTLLIFLLIFKLSSLEFSPLTGILASIFLSFPLIDVVNSRLAKPDSLLNFLLFLTVYLSVEFFRKGKTRFLVFASVAAGLCVSSKYFFIGALPVFFAVVLRDENLKGKIRNLFISGAIALVSFAITCPYCILDYQEVLKTFSGAQNFKKGYIVPVQRAYIQVFSDLLKYTGYVVFFLFVVGLIMAFLKDWKLNLVIFAFPAVYLLMLAVTKVYGPRYLVYLFPYISLYAGYFLSRTLRKPALAVITAFLLSIPMASQSFRAINWLENRMSNREIMTDFIQNSLPNPRLVVSYHAYWLPTTRYSNFPRFSKHIGEPLFFIYGYHEKYFCSPGSRFLKWCGPLFKALPHYWEVLSLPPPPIPYAIDFSMSLLRKRRKPGEPVMIFPALPKLAGYGRLLFPGIPYVRDAMVKKLPPLGGVEKYYFYQGRGEICLMVRRISRKGKYQVGIDGKRMFLNRRVFYRCEVPHSDFGRVWVKSRGAYLEVLMTTSPVNLAQVLMKYFPGEAEKFLNSLKRNRYYSFEARRMLYLLYRQRGMEGEARKLKEELKPQVAFLTNLVSEKFRPRYRKAGFDPGYLSLSQRIYPEFERGKPRSKRFYLFPGVYIMSREFPCHLEMDYGNLNFEDGKVLVPSPGWARLVPDEKKIPLHFHLYFSPKDTLLRELDEISGEGQ